MQHVSTIDTARLAPLSFVVFMGAMAAMAILSSYIDGTHRDEPRHAREYAPAPAPLQTAAGLVHASGAQSLRQLPGTAPGKIGYDMPRGPGAGAATPGREARAGDAAAGRALTWAAGAGTSIMETHRRAAIPSFVHPSSILLDALSAPFARPPVPSSPIPSTQLPGTPAAAGQGGARGDGAGTAP